LELVKMQDLISAGVHFGHRTKRWNPKMEKFIFGKRNGVHIIDLRKTLESMKRAHKATVDIAERGKGILFVGTKKQAKDIIKEEAQRAGVFHITERWLGGLLTNFDILNQSVHRLREFEQMKEDGRWQLKSKKELSRLEREYQKLLKYFGGVKEMDRLPGLVFLADIKKDVTAFQEAKRKYDIEYDVFNLRITENGYVDEKHEKEVYDSHFRPRVRILKQRIGESLPRSLRSQRGKGHYYISGHIAILKDGQVEWYTCWESCKRFKNFDKDDEIGFLKCLLSQGLTLVKALCPDISSLKSPHDFLIDEFIKINPLRGRIEREVKVGTTIFTNKYGDVFDWRKAIDLVCYTYQEVWIIEAKPKLNWEAFGQVIAYASLFQKEHSRDHIQKGIICKEADTQILAVCEEFGINVFAYQEGKFQPLKAMNLS